MFGLGLSEIIFIAMLALIVVGPKKLPALLQAAGKGFGEFKRALDDIQKSVYESANPKDQSDYIEKLLKEREEYRAKLEASEAAAKAEEDKKAQDAPPPPQAGDAAPAAESAEEPDPFDAYLEIAQGDPEKEANPPPAPKKAEDAASESVAVATETGAGK